MLGSAESAKGHGGIGVQIFDKQKQRSTSYRMQEH